MTTPVLFSPLEVFLLRLPLMPMPSVYETLASTPWLEGLRLYAKHPVLREGVAAASPSLFSTLSLLEGSPEDRKTRQVASSFLRYLLRMSSRCTPFGLFAGIACGTFSDSTDVQVGATSEHRKRTRPDMLWLLTVVQRLEQRVEVFKQLRVQRNPALLHLENRYELHYLSECGQLRNNGGRKRKSIVLPRLDAIADVLAASDQPVLVTELLQMIRAQFSESSEQEVTGFLYKLFTQEFLLSDLRPPLTVENPMQYVLEKLEGLEGVEEERRELQEIAELICAYDRIPLGEGAEQYVLLAKRMNGWVETFSPLHTDVEVHSHALRLNREIAEEAARAATALVRLSSRRSPEWLSDYHAQFRERYGSVREVPVLELLYGERSLGLPDLNRRDSGDSSRIRLWLEQMIPALSRGEEEITLTDEFLARMDPEGIHPKQVPDTAELYAEVIGRSAEDIDVGEFQLVIGATYGTNRAGLSFARFVNMLEGEAAEEVHSMMRVQETLRPDATYVSASFLPPDGRVANVALCPAQSPYELTLGTQGSTKTPSLSLEDLVIGATANRLYVRSRSLGTEVIVTTDHLIGSDYTPDVLQVLKGISGGESRPLCPLEWGALEDAPYLPRVVYGKTVLSARRWRLYPQLLGFESLPNDRQAWCQSVAQWRKVWKVPRYLYLARYEKRILLDLDLESHVEELRLHLQRFESVRLYEKIGGFEQQWIRNVDGQFAMECVIPLVRQGKPPRHELNPLRARTPVEQKDRWRLPGSDWLYLKLYIRTPRQDEFLLNEWQPFTDDLVKSGLADRWFYIRYMDEHPHVRVRLQGSPEVLLREVLPRLHDFLQEHLTQGYLRSFVIDSYEREVERYGGVELMADAEAFFAADSQCALQLLNLVRKRKTHLPLPVLTGLSLLDLCTTAGLSFEKQLAWFEGRVDKLEFQDELRPWRRKLLAVADPFEGWEGLQREEPGGRLLTEAFALRRDAWRTYIEGVRAQAQKSTLTTSIDSILAAVLHMHCNRMLGISALQESKSKSFARYALYIQKHRRGLNREGGTSQ